MKKTVWCALIAVALLGVVVLLNLDGAVKSTIERVGTQTLGTPVHVGGMKVSLAEKSAGMSGLSIANPKGFKADDLLRTKAVSVVLGDFANKVVTIREVVVDGMVVTYELGPAGTNLDVVRKNIKSSGGAGDSSAAGGGVEVIIQRLRIINAQVIPALGTAQAPIRLPDMTLNNIGSKSNPASTAQVAAQIMNKVLMESSLAVVRAGLNVSVSDTVTKVKKNLLKGLFSK